MHASILIVCTGNICRSPMGAGLLRARLPADSNANVASAGIGALVAEPAHPSAVALLEGRGIDISDHRGRQVDRAAVVEHDLILVMERLHAQWITKYFPTARGRVFLLGHWRGAAEVPDPYGQPEGAFEEALELLEACVEDWARRIAKPAAANN